LLLEIGLEKPIEARVSYNLERREDGIGHNSRACTTCFDGKDDDDGDGIEDKRAIPHRITYELKQFQGIPGKCTGKPSDWITDIDLHHQGVTTKDESHHFLKVWREANPLMFSIRVIGG